MQAFSEQEVMRYQEGSLCWGPAVASNQGALALIERESNSGGTQFLLAELDSGGTLVAQSKPLPLQQPHPGGAIVATGAGEALVVVLDRKERRFELSGQATCFLYNRPRWFRCVSNSSNLELTEVDFWEGVNASRITATLRRPRTMWTMVTSRYATDPVVSVTSMLAYGFADGSALPVLKETELSCNGATHLATGDGHMLALIESGFKEIQLWRLSEKSAPQEVASLTARGQRRGEVSNAVLFKLRDGFVFFWRYFNKRVRKEQRDGGLWFRTCEPGLTRLDEPCRLSDDREIPATAWRSFDLGDSILVVWKNGLIRGKQEVRYVRVRTRAELPKTPRMFPGDLPAHVLPTPRGLLVLNTVFSESPYSWSLRSELLDPARGLVF